MSNENKMIEKLKSFDVSEDDAEKLNREFLPSVDEVNKLKEESLGIVVSSVDDLHKIKRARELRIQLKNIRIETEKKRKLLKEESLRKGKAIDGVANIVKYLIVPVEEHLQKQENFMKLIEEKRTKEIKEKREKELRKYDVCAEFLNVELMSEEGFVQLLENSKIAFNLKIEAEKEAEIKRLERDKKEKEEQQIIKKENEILKKEQEKMRLEREKLEKENQEKLNKEREEKEKIEEENKKIKERLEKEKQIELEKELAEKKRLEKIEMDKLLLPDKNKLIELATVITSIEMPNVKSAVTINIIKSVTEMLNKTSNYIKEQSLKL